MQLTKLTDSITQLTCSGSQIVLFELDLRLIVKWVWQNRPDIVRDIVCEECPEHAEIGEYQDYFMNKAEHGE